MSGIAVSDSSPLAARLRLVAWMSAGTVIGVYLALSAFVQPQADDWDYAHIGREGWIAAQSHYYCGWNGRFTATALQTSLGLIPAWFAPACRVAAALLICAFTAAAAALATAISPGSRASARLAACAGVAVYLCTFLPREGFYWMAGGLSYETASTLAMVAAAGAVRLSRGAAPGWLWFCVPAAGLLAAGCCEIIVPLLAIGCAAGWWWQRREPRALAAWSALAAGLACGALIVIAAPGNAVRVASLGGLRPLPTAGAQALHLAAAFSGRLLGSPVALMALGAAVLVASSAPNAATQRGSWRASAALVGVGLAGVTIAAVPPLVAVGTIDPHVFDLLWWWLLLWTALAFSAAILPILRLSNRGRVAAALIAAAVALMSALRSDDSGSAWSVAAGTAGLAVLALTSALFRPSLIAGLAAMTIAVAIGPRDAWYDLVARGPAYAGVWSRRWAILEAARADGEAVAVVPRLSDEAYPRTLCCADLQPLPGTRWNPQVAEWFGIREIWLDSPLPPDHPLSLRLREQIERSRQRWAAAGR